MLEEEHEEYKEQERKKLRRRKEEKAIDLLFIQFNMANYCTRVLPTHRLAYRIDMRQLRGDMRELRSI